MSVPDCVRRTTCRQLTSRKAAHTHAQHTVEYSRYYYYYRGYRAIQKGGCLFPPVRQSRYLGIQTKIPRTPCHITTIRYRKRKKTHAKICNNSFQSLTKIRIKFSKYKTKNNMTKYHFPQIICAFYHKLQIFVRKKKHFRISVRTRSSDSYDCSHHVRLSSGDPIKAKRGRKTRYCALKSIQHRFQFV